MDALFKLSDHELRSISRELRAGRISLPIAVLALQEYCPGEAANAAASEIDNLAATGMTPVHIAACLEAIAEARTRQQKSADSVELVWTGPEVPGTTNRDTGVVVRELFAAAQADILIAGFAVHQGKRIFQELAERMDQDTHLRVRMFLNVARGQTDTSTDAELLNRFLARIRSDEWPGKRLPEIYYDPRSLIADGGLKRASLHAKTIVVDRSTTFVTSANFTEAAQARNIELGTLIRSSFFAAKVIWHFESLTKDGTLKRAT